MAEEKNLNEGGGWKSTRMLPADTQAFTANGREYRVSRSISFERYEAYEMLQVEVGLARTFEQFTEQIKEAYSLCNQVASGKHVFADLAVLLRDMLIGTQLVGERQTPAVLKLCALFINRENEDVRWVDDSVIESKINDWRQEGIDIRFFFAFALNSIPGFIEALRAVSLDTSSVPAPPQPAPSSTSRPESSRSAT
jgi:hypothetical protein